ncbi:uncharacterized protein TNCV_1491091 [Trichonephila clavipes]|nr:uncharacterized protein TNCV_1491091 [Trichonephila clavipes]
MQERERRRPTRIIKRDRRAFFQQIAADFNAGSSTSVTVQTILRNSIDMGFRSRRSIRVPLLCDMGPPMLLDTTLTGDRYVSILSPDLHPFKAIVHSGRLGEFKQDNRTPHTSKIATE